MLLMSLDSPTGIVSPLLMSTLLHHLCEAVGDGQGGVDESLHTAHQARLRPVV